MLSIIIYPVFVEKYLRNKDIRNNIAPRKIAKNEYLKTYHRYISNEFDDSFKVEEEFIVEDHIYYTIKFDNTNRYATISYPNNSEIFELGTEKSIDFLDREIMNSGVYYYGYRIKKWFYNLLNNDDIYHEKFSLFSSYLNYDDKNTINDNKMYKLDMIFDLSGNIIKSQFTCKNKL